MNEEKKEWKVFAIGCLWGIASFLIELGIIGFALWGIMKLFEIGREMNSTLPPIE